MEEKTSACSARNDNLVVERRQISSCAAYSGRAMRFAIEEKTSACSARNDNFVVWPRPISGVTAEDAIRENGVPRKEKWTN